MREVQFTDVGRNKASFKITLHSEPGAPIEADDERRMIRACKSYLMSRGIDIEYDEGERSGSVLVGGWRPVGRWRVIEPIPPGLELDMKLHTLAKLFPAPTVPKGRKS